MKYCFMIAVLLTSLIVDAKVSKKETKKFHALLDQIWQSQLALSPQSAAYFGDKSKSGQLNDVSLSWHEKQNKVIKSAIHELKEINPKKLSNTDRINYQMQQTTLANTLADNLFKEFQMPITAEGSFHVNLASMGRTTRFQNEDDIKNYLNKLKQVPRAMKQHMDNMQAGLDRGFSQPRAIIGHYPEFISTYIKEDSTESPFYQPFMNKPKHVVTTDFTHFQQQAKDIIRNDINPSYNKFKDFMVDEYLPKAKQSIAAYDFPDGKAYYQQQIREYTTLDWTPEKIHNIGLAEVKRIRAEMEQIITDLQFEGSFAEFLEFLRTDPQFYANTPEALLKEARDIAKRMDGKLPELFTKLPRQPYAVNPVPAGIAPNYTTGRYVSAPLNSTRPGQYWVNTYALEKRPLYNLEALTFHEAVPGHHLQGALNAELENLPKFRRYSYISAFGEGWGLYCEKLAKEVGFYQDPYSDFGRLTYEMWRAMRLVVDTGMHAMGMTRDEAIKLMEENTALSKHNVRTEIDRYIAWPAQALSYKLGEIKIWELRNKAEKALGSNFDIRTFHDALLSKGPVPLDVLTVIIDEHIQNERKKANL
ncbi:DUF885 domain-containing protein [Marinicella rhabdoformis]|uniref:DUF885 domain-containing protein n=1 Tax=Marinicella rhabdoformis TaxID=2580566 RepID=UPI001FE7FD5D|nr:DUF885 domain-containing protein [Marinicella rhabdoformis]